MVIGQVAYDMDIPFLEGAAKLNCRYEGKPSGMGFFSRFSDTPYRVVVGNGDNIQSTSGRPSDHLPGGIKAIGDVAVDMKVYLNLYLLFPRWGLFILL